MSNEEMILSTIKKVYAIRASVERLTEERIAGSLPVIGYVRVAVAGTSLSRDQVKDLSAFITATCTTPDRLAAMDTISAFKAKTKVRKPAMVWVADIMLFLPLLLVIAAEAFMVYRGMLTQITYLAIALALVLAALLAGITLFSVLGYDAEFRRDTIEHKLWKHMNAECKKRKKQAVYSQNRLQPPATPAVAKPAIVNRK